MASSATPSSACFIGNGSLTHGCHILAKEAAVESFHCKDPSKRKRVNRNARLKQCKRDARREQWLSQGKQKLQNICSPTPDSENTGVEEKEQDCNSTISSSCNDVEELSSHCSNVNQRADLLHLEMESSERKAAGADTRDMRKLPDFDDFTAPVMSCLSDCSEAGSSPKSCEDKSPKSKITKLGRTFESGRTRQNSGSNNNKKRDNIKSNKRVSGPIDNKNSDLSDSSNVTACCSVSGKEGSSSSHDSEDDWEAAADALDLQSSPSGKCYLESTGDNIIASINKLLHSDQIEENQTKSKTLDWGRRALNTRDETFWSLSGKAWRSDDSTRPPCLPTLTKKQNLPIQYGNQGGVPVQKAAWAPPPAPSHCPLCIEELDSTDASFMPCMCGYRLCLFCHHRIMLEDGRCPGCRKPYDKDIPKK